MAASTIITIIIVILGLLMVFNAGDDSHSVASIHDVIQPGQSKQHVEDILGVAEECIKSVTSDIVSEKLYYKKRKTRDSRYRYKIRIDLKNNIVSKVSEGDFSSR